MPFLCWFPVPPLPDTLPIWAFSFVRHPHLFFWQWLFFFSNVHFAYFRMSKKWSPTVQYCTGSVRVSLGSSTWLHWVEEQLMRRSMEEKVRKPVGSNCTRVLNVRRKSLGWLGMWSRGFRKGCDTGVTHRWDSERGRLRGETWFIAISCLWSMYSSTCSFWSGFSHPAQFWDSSVLCCVLVICSFFLLTSITLCESTAICMPISAWKDTWEPPVQDITNLHSFVSLVNVCFISLAETPRMELPSQSASVCFSHTQNCHNTASLQYTSSSCFTVGADVFNFSHASGWVLLSCGFNHLYLPDD